MTTFVNRDPSCLNQLDLLDRLLRKNTGTIRYCLTLALAALEAEETLPGLDWALRHRGQAVEAAIEALANRSCRPSCECLLQAHEDGKISHRYIAELLAAIISHEKARASERMAAAQQALDTYAPENDAEPALLAAARREETRPLILQAGLSCSPRLRLAVALALANSNPDQAAEHFRFALHQGEDKVRHRCAKSVFKIRVTMEDLYVLASDPDRRVRRATAWALPLRGRPDSAEVLLALCRDRAALVRAAAIHNSYRLGEQALPVLNLLCRDRSSTVRESAAYAAARLSRKWDKPCRVELLKKFLYLDDGTPVDPRTGEFLEPCGGEPLYDTIASELERMQHPNAQAALAEWKANGGKSRAF